MSLRAAGRDLLTVLDARIEQRSRATAEAHEFWPCRRGCDGCCRTLSQLPHVTEPEWHRMRAALASLDGRVRSVVAARIAEAPEHGPLVCPMLDRTQGECHVYRARPLVCRMHGFYTERDAGLHCQDVSASVLAHGVQDQVVWGNGESMHQALRPFGEARPLRSWLADDARDAELEGAG